MDKGGEPLDNNIHKEKGNLEGKNISARKKRREKPFSVSSAWPWLAWQTYSN